MKTFQLTLTAMLLLSLTTAAVAQDSDSEAQYIKLNRKAAYYSDYRVGSRADLFVLQFASGNDDLLGALGIEKDLHKKIFDAGNNVRSSVVDTQNDPMLQTFHNDAVFKSLRDEYWKFNHASRAEEMQKTSIDLRRKLDDYVIRKLLNEHLTPDQMKTVQEFQISAMFEAPIIVPSMFEALNLSDVQKQQMDEIKKELEPELEKQIDKKIETEWKFNEKLREEFDRRLAGVTDPDEWTKQRGNIDNVYAVMDTVRKSYPRIHQEMQEMEASRKAFMDKLKVKMFDVLTDEQWNRMVQLIDDPPDYVKAYLKQLKERRAENKKPEVWVPGADSWKPGDPIPEGYRQQRQEGRFPRNVQSE